MMGHGDEQKRRHRPSRDDRSPPRTRPSANYTTPTSVPTTTERSCLPPEKRHSIDEWVKLTDSSRRHRSREKRPSRSPAAASDPTRHTRDLTRDMSNMALTKGSRSKKPPRGTLHVDERAVSPSVDEGHAWLEGDALTDTPETRMAEIRAVARETKRSSKELDLSPFMKGKETSQYPQYYVDYSVERSPSRSPSRKYEHTSGTNHRTTGRKRSRPSRKSAIQDEPSHRDTEHHKSRSGTLIPYGHQENREEPVSSRRLPPAPEDLNTSHGDAYALTKSQRSGRHNSRPPPRKRSSRSEIVRAGTSKDYTAVVPTSRPQDSEEVVNLKCGKPVVMRVVLIILGEYCIPRGSKQMKRGVKGGWEDFVDLA